MSGLRACIPMLKDHQQCIIGSSWLCVTGSLPESWGETLPSLQTLDVSVNNLTGMGQMNTGHSYSAIISKKQSYMWMDKHTHSSDTASNFGIAVFGISQGALPFSLGQDMCLSAW